MVFYRKSTRIIFNAVFKRIYRTSDRYAQADKGRIAHATNSKLLQTFPMCADKWIVVTTITFSIRIYISTKF